MGGRAVGGREVGGRVVVRCPAVVGVGWLVTGGEEGSVVIICWLPNPRAKIIRSAISGSPENYKFKDHFSEEMMAD